MQTFLVKVPERFCTEFTIEAECDTMASEIAKLAVSEGVGDERIKNLEVKREILNVEVKNNDQGILPFG